MFIHKEKSYQTLNHNSVSLGLEENLISTERQIATVKVGAGNLANGPLITSCCQGIFNVLRE